MVARGIIVTYETIRQCCQKFGQHSANQFVNSGHRLVINGISMRSSSKSIGNYSICGGRSISREMCSISSYRAGGTNRLPRRDWRKLLKGCQYVPRVLITDKLASYGAAKKELLPSLEHRQHKRLNNRAENSDQPTRQRERVMRRFKTAGHAQRFLAAHGPIREHFCPHRHRLSAKRYRVALQERFAVWNTITGVQIAA